MGVKTRVQLTEPASGPVTLTLRDKDKSFAERACSCACGSQKIEAELFLSLSSSLSNFNETATVAFKFTSIMQLPIFNSHATSINSIHIQTVTVFSPTECSFITLKPTPLTIHIANNIMIYAWVHAWVHKKKNRKPQKRFVISSLRTNKGRRGRRN